MENTAVVAVPEENKRNVAKELVKPTLSANDESRKKRKVTGKEAQGIADVIGADDCIHMFTKNVGKKPMVYASCVTYLRSRKQSSSPGMLRQTVQGEQHTHVLSARRDFMPTALRCFIYATQR